MDCKEYAQRMSEEEVRQLSAFMQLPKPLRDWWQKKVFIAFTTAGREPDYVEAWFNLSIEARWKLIGYLVAESVPSQSLKIPVIKPSDMRALKSAVPTSSPESISSLPRPDTIADSTEKVKKILLTWSKVRFIGNEGSGKTSKARWLCRQRIPLGHQIYWINPHLNADDKHKLDALNVIIVGGGRDYAAIARFCHEMVVAEDSELNLAYAKYGSEVGAKFPPKTFVFDELTNYKDQEVLKAPIQTVMKASMQEFSKINWNSIYITHNDTLSCMAMPDGTRNLVDSSVFDLKLEADITKGNRVPKATAKYRMPNTDNWLPVTIPVDWQ